MHDYTQHVAAPDQTQFAKLNSLVDKLNEAERKVAQAEAELKAAQEEAKDVAERRLPELMDEMGLKEFVTTEGSKVKLRETISARLPVARRNEAFNWLEENGFGGLIKRNVTVRFTREQQEEARELVRRLGREFPSVEEDSKVEPATLSAFVRERLEAGDDIDMELFGVYARRTVKIS